MSLSPDTETLLLAYIDGELSDVDAKAFEARVAADPELLAEVEGLRAVRMHLDGDAAFGLQSGLDVPPPQLLDAIVRAEVLARAPEVQKAAAQRMAARAAPAATSWWQRLSSWTVGGGALVTAGVLALMLTHKDNVPAPSAATGAALGKVAASPTPLVRPMQVAVQAARPDDEDGNAPPPMPLPPTATVPMTTSRADAKPAPTPAPSAAPMETPGRGGGAVADSVMKGVAEPELKQSAKAEAATKPSDVADGPAIRSEDQRERRRAVADAAPQMDKASNRVDDDSLRMAEAMPAKKTAAPPALAPPPPPAPAPPPRDPMTQPSANGFAAVPGAVASGGSVGAGSAGKAKDHALSSTSDEKFEASAKRDAPKAPMPHAEADRRADQASMSFLTAMHELDAGRALDALDLFQQAAMLDRGNNALGVGPLVGQMKALTVLKRPRDVVRLSVQLDAHEVKEAGVVDGLRVGATAAETIGDIPRARALYLRLATWPATQKEANAALQRLSAPAAADVQAAPAASKAR